ncbi:hypothetical protein PQR67_31640 [Paraburkholderia fungorum]
MQKRQAGAKKAQAGAHDWIEVVWSVRRDEVANSLLLSNESGN